MQFHKSMLKILSEDAWGGFQLCPNYSALPTGKGLALVLLFLAISAGGEEGGSTCQWKSFLYHHRSFFTLVQWIVLPTFEHQLLISSLARVLANMIIAAGLHSISAKIWLVDERDSTHQLMLKNLPLMLALYALPEAPLIMPKAMPPY